MTEQIGLGNLAVGAVMDGGAVGYITEELVITVAGRRTGEPAGLYLLPLCIVKGPSASVGDQTAFPCPAQGAVGIHQHFTTYFPAFLIEGLVLQFAVGIILGLHTVEQIAAIGADKG